MARRLPPAALALLLCLLPALAGCRAPESADADCPEALQKLVRDAADEMFLSPGTTPPEEASPQLRELLAKVAGTPHGYKVESSYRAGDQCVIRYVVEGLLLKGGRETWSGFVIFTAETGPPPAIVSIDFAS